MTIKLPMRSYLTLQELIERWECTENDLRDLIARGILRPSYFIHHVARKVRFQIDRDDAGTYWVPKAEGEYLDEEGVYRCKLYDVSGPYFLLHPNLKSALDCTFFYFSQDRDHVQGPDEKNMCFAIAGKGEWENGITLDMVFEKGMIMLSEIARFEEKQEDKPLMERERETLLNIIAVMLELLKSPRQGRTTDSAVMTEMIENYGEKPGIKLRTLQEKIPAAKRSLMSS